ncbi:MAG: hypothetical protein ACI4PS_02495 [Rhodocyclaceae bacterium]
MYDNNFYNCKNDLFDLLEKTGNSDERQIIIGAISQLFQEKSRFDVEHNNMWAKLDETQRKLWVEQQKNQMEYAKK